MKNGEAPVKSKRVVVGIAKYPVYDSVSEAVSAIGEEIVLAHINRDVCTAEKNRIRAAATSKPSRKELDAEAFARIAAQDPQRIVACAGDAAKVRALLDSEVEVILAELEAKRASLVVSEDGEAEEDEE